MGVRILLVEDDKYFNKLLFDRLSLEGHQVTSVLDGEAAWTALEASSPMFEIVISDMLLPRLMGAELFTRIREQNKYEKLPLIAISGVYKDSQQIEEICALHQLRAYWTKPFDLGRFVSTLGSEEPLEVAITTQGPDQEAHLRASLAERKIELLLLDAYNRAFSGRLQLKQEQLTRNLYFANGFPVSAESSAVSESLGQSFVALNLITREVQQSASQRMVLEGIQFGQMLLKMNALTKEQLFDGLRKHVYRLLLQSFLMNSGEYEWIALNQLPERVLPLEFNPILLMIRAHKAVFSDTFLSALYQTKQDLFPHRTARGVQILPLFNLDPESLEFLVSLPSDQSLKQVLRTIPATAHPMLLRVFYLLEVLQLMDWRISPSGLAQESVPHANFEAHFQPAHKDLPTHEITLPADPSLGADPEHLPITLGELQAEYIELLGKDYFKIFQLPESKEISHEALESAYRALRYRLHPDRFNLTAESGQQQRILDDMLARIDRAYQMLTTEDTRHDYVHTLQSQRQDSAVDSKRFLEAQEIFREAQSLLSAQKYAAAAEGFERAYQKWNRGFEYAIYASYSELRAGVEKNDEANVQRLLIKLRAQAFENRSHDLGFLLLGHAQQATGRPDLAKDSYQLALQNNEANDEAAHALAKLGEVEFKKGRRARVIERSKTGLKQSLFYGVLIFAAIGAFFLKDQIFQSKEEGVQAVNVEDLQPIAPVLSGRRKEQIAKLTFLEGKIAEMPTPVLNSKCVQILIKLKPYGILEIYLYDDKTGLKAFCRGEELQRYDL